MWLNAKEAAKALGKSPRTIARWRKEGRLKYEYLGCKRKGYLYWVDATEEHEESRQKSQKALRASLNAAIERKQQELRQITRRALKIEAIGGWIQFMTIEQLTRLEKASRDIIKDKDIE